MTPRTLRLPTRIAILAMLVTTAISAATAAPASASLGIACPDPTFQPFAPWGDSSSYAFAPNGGFENGATGWSLTGSARVVTGNEPFVVHRAGDRYSLSIPAGSSATTARMCIGAFSTKMRFFARNTGASTARLTVKVIYDGGLGQVLGIADVGTITGGKWQPSPAITMLGGILPLLTQDVRIRFVPADATGNWSIDDVYVDPLMHR
jgi:hypothetical protein